MHDECLGTDAHVNVVQLGYHCSSPCKLRRQTDTKSLPSPLSVPHVACTRPGSRGACLTMKTFVALLRPPSSFCQTALVRNLRPYGAWLPKTHGIVSELRTRGCVRAGQSAATTVRAALGQVLYLCTCPHWRRCVKMLSELYSTSCPLSALHTHSLCAWTSWQLMTEAHFHAASYAPPSNAVRGLCATQLPSKPRRIPLSAEQAQGV